MMQWLGQLIGITELQAVDNAVFRFAAPWATANPAVLMFALICVMILAVVFYHRLDRRGHWQGRAMLSATRASLLALLVVLLAEPTVDLSITRRPKPWVVLLFDATASMQITDHLSPEQRQQISQSLDLPTAQLPSQRIELMRQILTSNKLKLPGRLSESFRIQAFAIDHAEHLRALHLDPANPDPMAQEIQPTGQVTALGNALIDLAGRQRTNDVAAAVIFSDFVQNAGPPAADAARLWGKPIYTVGIGPADITDLSVKLRTPLHLKKDERSSVRITLEQTGLDHRSAIVRLQGQWPDPTGTGRGPIVDLAPPAQVRLQPGSTSIDLPITPEQPGRLTLIASVTPFDDEQFKANNTAQRDVHVRNDALRILFIEYEPTWEWRFVKEVFHRDPLVGKAGYRTYLHSADFTVKQNNPMFLQSMVISRAELFNYDVIILGDIPADLLSERLQQMLQEYVGRFGGGLVMLSGPRFGPRALAGTPLAEMMPVIIDLQAQRRDGQYQLKLTPAAAEFPLMNLGTDARENIEAWQNINPLIWYQPVTRPHPMATVLAEHTSDRIDTRTPQPLIAHRRYGRGQVLWFGFNELWRLRRLYGEKYYRQFWGQLIYRMGMGRALGSQKRFVVSTDRQTYQAGDRVRLTVEAYDRQFNPMPTETLTARHHLPGSDQPVEMTIPMARDQVIFETTRQVFTPGEHQFLIQDPVTGEQIVHRLIVAPTSVEQRGAKRNVGLQKAIAQLTGGQSLTIEQLAQLPQMIDHHPVTQISVHHLALWNTWIVMIVVLALMIGEWVGRKWMNLQ